MFNPSPLKQKFPSRPQRSPIQYYNEMKTPDRNQNRSPFTNIQNSSSSKTIKPYRQQEIVGRIIDKDDHSPMKMTQHLNFLHKQDRRFINDSQDSSNNNNYTLINRLSELEIQLRKSALQEAILERELESMQNQLLVLKSQNQDQDDDIQMLRDQIKDMGRITQSKHMDEINKLHSLLKEKNNVILQWTNRYLSLEKKYELDHNAIRDYTYHHLAAEDKDDIKKNTNQKERESLVMTRQIEALQMQLNQTKDQVVLFEKDRNSWVEKYESLVQSKYKNIDDSKEKLIELRIMNQMLESKCKDLKEEKDKLTNQMLDMQTQFMQIKSYNIDTNEKTMKDKELRLNSLYSAALTENQQQRLDIQEQTELIQTQEKQLKQYENKVYELEYQLNRERDQCLKEIDQQRSESQSHRIRDDELQLQKQLLDKDNSILRTRLNESEFKQRQLENENEKLHQIRQEKQREIDIWTRKAQEIQNEYQARLEELTTQYSNKEIHQDTQQLEDKVDYFEQQYILARQEVDVWRQRVQLSEANSKKDDRHHLSIQMAQVSKEHESSLRQINLSQQEKDEEILELKLIIDQLQNENFEAKRTHEKQTDQILKLQLAFQQLAHNYDSQGQPSREFSFQNNGEPQNEEQDQEEIYVFEFYSFNQFQIDRKKHETLQSDEDQYDHNYQSQ